MREARLETRVAVVANDFGREDAASSKEGHVAFKSEAKTAYRKALKSGERNPESHYDSYVPVQFDQNQSFWLREPGGRKRLFGITRSHEVHLDNAVITRTVARRFDDMARVVPLEHLRSVRAYAIGKDGQSVVFKFGSEFSRSPVHLLVTTASVNVLYTNEKYGRVGKYDRIEMKSAIEHIRVHNFADVGHALTAIDGWQIGTYATGFNAVTDCHLYNMWEFDHIDATIAKAAVRFAHSRAQARSGSPELSRYL